MGPLMQGAIIFVGLCVSVWCSPPLSPRDRRQW